MFEIRIGAHVSISKSFSKSIYQIEKIKGNCGQIFLHSPREWEVRIKDEKDIEDFKKLKNEKELLIGSHSSYLINLAFPKTFEKSLNLMQKEIELSKKLGLDFYVFHPGSHKGIGSFYGIKNLIKGLNSLETNKLEIMIENSAAEGFEICHKLEQISFVIEKVKFDLKFCLDIQHAFASGYDIKNNLENFLFNLDKKIGFENLRLIHLNDSKVDLGSCKDRHENLGKGKIGWNAIFNIVSELKDKIFILETPSSRYKEEIESILRYFRKKI